MIDGVLIKLNKLYDIASAKRAV